MQKGKANLDELKREAEKLGAKVIKSLSRSRCYITDGREIVIATTDGTARIPIEQAMNFWHEFANVMRAVSEMLTDLSSENKELVAREKGMSYGQIQALITELGGSKNEPENR
ncbi:hypothetical protein [Emergencia sp.]|uniref:hypothetical protein n=1 Tax=Emergencia sp. TaxID=1926557 RepID=UPI003AF112E1